MDTLKNIFKIAGFPKCLQFWNMKQQIRWYLEDVFKITPEHNKGRQIYKPIAVIMVLFAFKCVQLLLLMLFNLNDFLRLVCFDITFFFDCPQYLNIFTLQFILHGAGFTYKNRQLIRAYEKVKVPLFLVQNTIFGQNNDYFLKASFKTRLSRKITEVDDMVRMIVNLYRWGFYYLFEFYTAFFAVLFIVAVRIVILNNYHLYFFGSVSGLVAFLFMQANAFSLYLAHIWLIMADGIVSMVILTFSSIFFIRLSQIDRLLKRKNKGKSKNNGRLPSEARLCAFFTYHTETFCHILYANCYFGAMLFIYLILLVPVNSSFLLLTALGTFNYLGTFFYANSILFQFLAIILFHLIAASYTSRIHRGVKQLPGIMARAPSGHFSLDCRLKCAHYIFKFQGKKYGISYSEPRYGFGLISMTSFTKFVLIYFEFIMFTFKISRQIEQ